MKILQRRTTTYTPNWLVKIAFWVGIVTTTLLTACEAPKEIGLPPEVIADVKFIDTLTVTTSTVLLDSVRTSNTFGLLVGRYKDATFGQVTARPYFEVTNIPNLTADGKTYLYDSLYLQVGYSYVYGDTTRPFLLNVHRLTDTIRTNRTYYNNSVIEHDPTAIASAALYPTPNLNRTISIKLPTALGKEMFDALSKSEVTTLDQFRKRFRGFTFVPAASNNAVLGFGVSPTEIRLSMYLHESTADTVRSEVRFGVLNRFNYVQASRQGTVLSQLQPLKPLAASQTGGMTYIHDALGVVNKLEFPYLSKLLQSKEIAINRAELTIVPNTPNVLGLTDWPNYLYYPQAMMLVETDATNRLLRSRSDHELILGEDGSTFLSVITPQIRLLDSKFRNYTFVLTTYLQAVMTGYKKTNGLLLAPVSISQVAGITSQTGRFQPYLNNRVNTMTITPNRNNLKLMLFYTTTK